MGCTKAGTSDVCSLVCCDYVILSQGVWLHSTGVEKAYPTSGSGLGLTDRPGHRAGVKIESVGEHSLDLPWCMGNAVNRDRRGRELPPGDES